MKRFLCALVSCLLCFSACGQDTTSAPTADFATKTPYTPETTVPSYSGNTDVNDPLYGIMDGETLDFSSPESVTVTLTSDDAESMASLARSLEVDYEHMAYFDLAECECRLSRRPHVAVHEASALDASGRLTVDHLADLVKENNEAYMATGPMLVELPSDERIKEVCTVIAEYIERGLQWIESQGISVDKERVYCNLADLKIINKPGMLDFATVTKDRIMYISDNSEQILNNMYGDHAFYDTLVHETMHLLQIGCGCEDIASCERRAGIAYSYSDFPMNSLDWSWFPEAIAEHSMSTLTGDDPITYASLIKYLNTMHLVALPSASVPFHRVDAIGYTDDPEALFSLLSLDRAASDREMMSMMIAVNTVLNEPEAFTQAYQTDHNVDLETDRDAYNSLYYPMEADVCTTLSKCFYVHLATLLTDENSVTVADLAYMIHLFETAMEGHLRYSKADYEEYNSSFLNTYSSMREAFFERVTMSDGGDFASYYDTYSLFADDDSVAASMQWCDSERREWLLTLTEELSAFYQKVPK